MARELEGKALQLDLEIHVAQEHALGGAQAVDVSSGVEERPGVKSPARITAFLELARTL